MILNLKLLLSQGGISMKIQKLFALPLLCGSILLSSTSVFASETAEVESPVQQTFSISSDGISRASWGRGILTHANPLGRKPWAYATSKTFAGKCYTLKARTKVQSGGKTDYTSWATKNNASSVTSATIIARTENGVKFTGNHEFRDTATSGWQYATTNKSY